MMTNADLIDLTDRTMSKLFQNHEFSTQRPPAIAGYANGMHAVDGVVEIDCPAAKIKRHYVVLIDSTYRPRVVKVVIDGETLTLEVDRTDPKAQ